MHAGNTKCVIGGGNAGLASTKRRLTYGNREPDAGFGGLAEHSTKKRLLFCEKGDSGKNDRGGKSATKVPKSVTTAAKPAHGGCTAPEALTTSLSAHANSAGRRVQTPCKFSKRELLRFAKRHGGTAVQYHATYHRADAILDKNSSGKGDEFSIEDGDLIIRQDCANARGTYWTAKFGFDRWRLPGRRATGRSIYASTRPILTDDAEHRQDHRPRLVVDARLGLDDDARVRKFVKEAGAGENPLEFFSRAMPPRREVDPCDGAEAGGKNSGLPDGAPSDRRALGDISNRAIESTLPSLEKKCGFKRPNHRVPEGTLSRPRKKQKARAFVDILGDADSPFGCEIIAFDKPRSKRKNQACCFDQRSSRSRETDYTTKCGHRSNATSVTTATTDHRTRGATPQNYLNDATRKHGEMPASAGAMPDGASSFRAEVEATTNVDMEENYHCNILKNACDLGTSNPEVCEGQTAISPNNKASCLFEGCGEGHEVDGMPAISNSSNELPFHGHDGLFGNGSADAGQSAPSMANPSPACDPQPFHDCLYGQETCHTLGGPDVVAISNSSVQSDGAQTDEAIIPFFDYYYGQDHCTLAASQSNSYQPEEITKRIARLSKMSGSPVLVITLLAGMLVRCVQA